MNDIEDIPGVLAVFREPEQVPPVLDDGTVTTLAAARREPVGEARLDFIAMAGHIRAEHEATHGEAEMCGGECIVLGLTDIEAAIRGREGLDGFHQATRAIAWADQLDRAYEDGYARARAERPLLLQSTAFGLGLVVGMFLAVMLAYAQVAR